MGFQMVRCWRSRHFCLCRCRGVGVVFFLPTFFPIGGCFRKWWYPQIIHFDRVFHYKPSILGYPYIWKHPGACGSQWGCFTVSMQTLGFHPHAGSMKVCSQRRRVCSLKIHWYVVFTVFRCKTPRQSDFRNGRQGGNSGKSVGNLDFKVPQFVVFHRDNLGCFLQKMGACWSSYWAAICFASTDDIRGDTTILRKHSLLGEEFWFPDESSKARHPLKAGSPMSSSEQ